LQIGRGSAEGSAALKARHHRPAQAVGAPQAYGRIAHPAV
jgi:hypothetical protein